MRSFGFYEFFAGGGMARAGLGDDWECLFANDFDEKKAEAYRANWGDEQLHVGDVGLVTTKQLPGLADLVWASFPCQDLSPAGNGAGLNGARSGAFWPFWRLMTNLIAEGRKPRSIVLENVCGLLTSHYGADFQALCEHLAGAGYWIGAIIADARDFLPQSRPRLFLIGLDAGQQMPGHIFSGYGVDHWHPARLREAQANLPEALRASWFWFSPHVPAQANLTLAVGAIYKRTRHENGRRVQRAEIRFDVAGCLRTPGGGSSRQQILVAEPGRIRTRLISARETARLMGLDESYALPVRYNDAYHLTGDGVAVPVVRHIRETIIEPFLALNARMKASA